MATRSIANDICSGILKNNDESVVWSTFANSMVGLAYYFKHACLGVEVLLALALEGESRGEKLR